MRVQEGSEEKFESTAAYARGSEGMSHVQRVLPNRDREGVGARVIFYPT
jgi:hypothetical protein